MSNAYKAALQRFEDSIRAIERAAVDPRTTATEMAKFAHEYEAARHHMVQKLSYRALAAEERHREQGERVVIEYGIKHESGLAEIIRIPIAQLPVWIRDIIYPRWNHPSDCECGEYWIEKEGRR